MIHQVNIMLALQDKINTQVHSNWREQDFAWHRAAWMECAEMLEHYGWKWWKHQKSDIDQVRLELIDIFHFGLSMSIIQGIEADCIDRDIQSCLKKEKDSPEFAEILEVFIVKIIQERYFDMQIFSQLMRAIDLDFRGLFVGYIGKNILNKFRQNNGYKLGTYQKIWQDKEDNCHLAEIMQSLSPDREDFSHILYKKLEERYVSCVS